MPTVGIHVVWTAYGTWLPGDPRGHWSPLFDLYGRIIAKGGRLNMPDAVTRHVAHQRAREPPKLLSDAEQEIVADTIGALVAAGLSGRTLLPRAGPARPVAFAAAVEATHTHLLLGPVEEEISRCAGRMKGTSSSAVLALPENRGRHRVWTEGYWKVFLFDDLALGAVKEYVDQHNLRRGLPAARFPWITPLQPI